MLEMKFTALVTVAALVLTFGLSGRVGAMRQKHGVDAPAMTGHPEFERANRVHYNTIEQLVLFLPLLWLATGVIGDGWAAGLGFIWIAGRLVYAQAYQRDPAKRAPGMLVTLFATAALALSVSWGILQVFI
jgi:uncharacterized membrane protein YecN with MAPEG domain